MATKNETSIKNKNEDMMTKEEVVEMLRGSIPKFV